MNCITSLSGIKELPFIVVNDGIIADISEPFADMTEFKIEELLNKNIKDLFSTLKVGPDVNYENIDDTADYFLFTKSLDVRFISIEMMVNSLGKIYVFSEKPNSRPEEKFPAIEALCSHNKFGVAVYSTPDITLLKANQTYLNFLDKPFNNRENSIGKRIHEIIPGWIGSSSEDIWRNVFSTQKPFYSDEYMFEFERGVTYWEASLAPVFENGILKYCIEITTDITEKVLNRKKIEEQAKFIEQQKRELEAILDNMPDGVATVDEDGNYNKINKTLKQWLNNENPKKAGDTLKTFKYFDMQGNQLLEEDFLTHRVAKGERIEQYELLVDTGGSQRYFSLSGAPIYDENGSFVKGVINSRDITETVHNRERLQEQLEEIELKNKQMSAIFESIQDSISVFDREGRYLTKSDVNKKQFEPTDNDVWTVTEKTDFYNLDGSLLPKEKLCHPRLMRGEKVKNQKMKLVTGGKERYLSVSGTPIIDDNNEFQMGVMFSVDITDVVKLSEQLKEQKELLETIIENMSDGVVVADKEGKLLKINNETKRQFYHIETMSVLGESFKTTRYLDAEGKDIPYVNLPLPRALSGEEVRNGRMTIRRPDKELIVDVNASPIYDTDGDIAMTVALFRDVTELMKSQQALQETQEKLLKAEREKNEALQHAIVMKDEFLSLISHEFKTPINVINMAIQTLNFIYADQMNDKIKKYIGTIKQNANRQLRLVNNLLDITRANAGQMKIHKNNLDIVFLTKAITESVYEFAAKKKIQVAFVSKLVKRVIGIDDEKYERILLNLLSNAIKFTPEGESIVVKLSSLKGKICIEVKDSGIGIPSDKLEVIFERFGQVDSSLSRQAEGTGIGLSLVKKFVDALGGSISVKSKVGKGTTFKVLLLDETVAEESNENTMIDLMNDSRLIQTMNVELSDIYF